MNAVENGMKMLLIPMGELPVEARAYLDYLAGRVGLCLEVCLTAYAAYSQYILGMECDDSLYRIPADELKWWEENYPKTEQHVPE